MYIIIKTMYIIMYIFSEQRDYGTYYQRVWQAITLV